MKHISLIQKFDILEFLKLLSINIISLVVFVMIASKYYFNIISKSLEKRESKKEKNNKNINIKEKSKLLALVSKELKRYFSSTIYMFNTLTGSVLLLIATIGICFDLEGVINTKYILLNCGFYSLYDVNNIFFDIIRRKEF